MPKLPKVSGAEMVRILERAGYTKVRTRGSHVRLYPSESSLHKKVTVPLHKELKAGTLLAIMKVAGISIRDLS